MRTPFLSLSLVLCLGISAGASSHGKDGGKPRGDSCSVANRYDSNFTLHGLWPNRSVCGTGYGFCGSVHSESDSFPAVDRLFRPDAQHAGELRLGLAKPEELGYHVMTKSVISF